MQMKHYFPWMLSVMLALVSVWLLFQVVDRSVTVDHYSQEILRLQRQRNILRDIVNALVAGVGKNKIEAVLKREPQNEVFVEGGSGLVANGVFFEFEDGKLVRVEAGGR